MDIATLSSILALVLSAIALAASVVLTVRQTRLAHGNNFFNILQGSFVNLRSQEFLASREYVTLKMAQHDASHGYSGLPDGARLKVIAVSNFYNDLGKLVIHGALEESIVLSSFGEGLYATWEILHPYIIAERQLSPVRFMLYFEHLASRIREVGPHHVSDQYKLRTW